MIITIDGPSGTGKSTLAKTLAHKLHFSYFDTGALYRSFAWFILREGISPNDKEKVIEALSRFDFHIEGKQGNKRYFVQDLECTKEIREEKVGNLASEISSYLEVRKVFLTIQRQYAQQNNIVVEGRDMGTVVFPQAEYKIFLTASPEVRAQRRFGQLGENAPAKEKILKEMKKRDEKDQKRAHSPLKKAKDAYLIDTSNLSFEQVLNRVIDLYNKVRRKKKLFKPKRPFYSFILWLVKSALHLLYRMRVKGEENVPFNATILAANHASYLDPPVVAVSSPEEIHFLGKESLFSVPILSWLIRKMNTYPVSRGVGDAKVLKKVCHLLDRDKKVLLFPEGARTQDGKLQPLMPGLGFIAYKTKAPILPIYIKGTKNIWGTERRFPKLTGKITCVMGPPIFWENFSHLEKKEAMGAIVSATEKALHELEEKVSKKS